MASSSSLKRQSKQKSSKQVSEETSTLSAKELKAQQRQAKKARDALIAYTLAACAACSFVGLIISLIVDPVLGIGAGFGLLCLSLSFRYPRLAVYAFVAYIPFSGTITYALGGSSILQLAKDAFYIPAAIAVMQFCRRKGLPFVIPKSLKLALTLLLLLTTMTLLFVNVPQQFSSGDQAILIGILGLKTLVGYLFVIPCIYYLLRNREDLYFILRLQVVLILVACSLGLVQYFMLKTGICEGTTGSGADLFKASLKARCFVGGSLLYTPSQGQIRLPGTFVAPWQWGWFLISSAFFSFGTAFSDRSPLWRTVGLVSMVAVFIMAVISGQRIALMLVPTTVVILAFLTGQVANLKRFVPVGIGLALILTFLAIRNPEVIQARLNSFQSRWDASPPHLFIRNQFLWVMNEQQGILGRGVGRATNAARIFGEVELIETYHPKVCFEIGWLGLFALLILYTVLTVATFRAYRSTKEKNLRGYAASMWVFVLFISYFPYYYPLDVDPVNVYYWLAAGIALKIPEIDQRERLQASLEDPIQSGKAAKKLKSKKMVDFT
ncbi:hormogonium polysaccharide biosynthesis protein HpsL [Almyronema epifaneia]|uniref:Hormogonium polysaccharide biosynthesis protein HpsL n=1 Tax=Almyronema epifaneia S1 TaxID=2991925 RepID=A0ABW6IHA3_9CYAN